MVCDSLAINVANLIISKVFLCWNSFIRLRDIVIIYNITNFSLCVSVKVDYNMSTEGGGQRQSNHVIIKPCEMMPVRLCTNVFPWDKGVILPLLERQLWYINKNANYDFIRSMQSAYLEGQVNISNEVYTN